MCNDDKRPSLRGQVLPARKRQADLKNIYANAREECEEKLKLLIAEMKKEIEEMKTAGETAKFQG